MLVDDREYPVGRNGQGDAPPTPLPTPVDLELDWVLGKMPRKVRGGGKGGCVSSFPGPFTLVVLHCRVLSPLAGAHTAITICVAGVLPQEECPHAAASGLAPGAERGPGPREGSEAAFCGQQALPHQQGPPSSLALPLRPLHPPLSLPTLTSHSWGLLWGSTKLRGEVAGAGQTA